MATKTSKQQPYTCSTLFCALFLCRHCMTTTWKCLISSAIEDVIKRKQNFFPLPGNGDGSYEFNSWRVPSAFEKLSELEKSWWKLIWKTWIPFISEVFTAVAAGVPIRVLKIGGRRQQRKRRWKSEFTFFQSSSRLLQVTNFVKCRRTLLKLNS